MSVIVDTNKATELLASIKRQIDEGKIRTWSYDRNGDFIHTPDQWQSQARLRPISQPTALKFGIIGSNDFVMTKEVYGVYHGRFIEMLLTHFDQDFTSVHATPTPSMLDIFRTA